MRKLCSIFAIGLLAAELAGCATPLAGAAYAGRTEEVRTLLDKGADLHKSSACQQFNPFRLTRKTTLMCAIKGGHMETVKLLLDRGADLTSPDLLILAASENNPEIVKLLLNRGADPMGRGRGDWTALSYAALWSKLDNARMLIKHGADIDAAILILEQYREVAAVKFLERLKQSAQSPTGGISREEFASIIQATAGGAAQIHGQSSEHTKSIVSDIDTPAYKHAERPSDFALIVGIEKYSDIPAAKFAERDAEAVKNHLIAAGFPSRNVIQLFGEKAGRSSMEKFLETWLPRNVNEDSRVFFYFSGHGAPDAKTGQAYLIPWDGDPGFLENTGYPIKRLYEKLASLKAKEVVVAMDACFSGAGGRSVLAKGARPLVTKVDTASVPQKVTVFAAASGDQITSTLEDQGHGTFTYYFLKGLSGAAQNGSGTVTAKGLYDYLKPKVQDAARRQNRDQEPVLHAQHDQALVRF